MTFNRRSSVRVLPDIECFPDRCRLPIWEIQISPFLQSKISDIHPSEYPGLIDSSVDLSVSLWIALRSLLPQRLSRCENQFNAASEFTKSLSVLCPHGHVGIQPVNQFTKYNFLITVR